MAAADNLVVTTVQRLSVTIIWSCLLPGDFEVAGILVVTFCYRFTRAFSLVLT